MRREDIGLHVFGMDGFDPADSYGSCVVQVADTGEPHRSFAEGLRAAYGKVPLSGIPRMTRPRKPAPRSLASSPARSVLDWRDTRMIYDAFRERGRADLHVVPGVRVGISTSWRTALIPDISVLSTKPIGPCFRPEDLVLAVEIWSPGNSRSERGTLATAYAAAKVPFFWEVTQSR